MISILYHWTCKGLTYLYWFSCPSTPFRIRSQNIPHFFYSNEYWNWIEIDADLTSVITLLLLMNRQIHILYSVQIIRFSIHTALLIPIYITGYFFKANVGHASTTLKSYPTQSKLFAWTINKRPSILYIIKVKCSLYRKQIYFI